MDFPERVVFKPATRCLGSELHSTVITRNGSRALFVNGLMEASLGSPSGLPFLQVIANMSVIDQGRCKISSRSLRLRPQPGNDAAPEVAAVDHMKEPKNRP